MKGVYRVQRHKDGRVTVYWLDKPDMNGNSHWVVVARLTPSDYVWSEQAGRYVPVNGALIKDILESVIGGM